MVGLKNGHIRKNLTPVVNPRDIAGERKKKKKKKKNLRLAALTGTQTTHRLRLQRLLWIYYPGHAKVRGIEQVDRLTSTTGITYGLLLDKAELEVCGD